MVAFIPGDTAECRCGREIVLDDIPGLGRVWVHTPTDEDPTGVAGCEHSQPLSGDGVRAEQVEPTI